MIISSKEICKARLNAGFHVPATGSFKLGLALLALFLSFNACRPSMAQQPNAVSDAEMQAVYNEVRTPFKYGMVVVPGDDSKKIDCPSVFRKGKNWYMTYVLFDGRGYETWLAKSADLLNWNTLGRVMSLASWLYRFAGHKMGWKL
jgi:hypothetical protein